MPEKASLNLDQLISAASARHGVPEALVRGVIKQESGGDPLAVSNKGARGLMQLLPSTAADMGVQAHALRMAAEGVVAAFEEVVGEKWKPFERLENNAGPTLDRKAAGVQMAAFD